MRLRRYCWVISRRHQQCTVASNQWGCSIAWLISLIVGARGLGQISTRTRAKNKHPVPNNRNRCLIARPGSNKGPGPGTGASALL
jgi:hypothetical protein